MSDENQASASSQSPPRPRPELTRWKKVLIGIAGAFLVIGGGLRAFGGGGEPEPAGPDPAQVGGAGDPESGDDPLAPQNLSGDGSPTIDWPPQDPDDGSPTIEWPPKVGDGGDGGGDGGGPQAEEGAGAEPGAAGWSPFFLKGGFSFFVAFCVGYAVRVWLKIAAVFLGTFFIGLFLLSYFGAVDVDWSTLEGWWDALAAHVDSQATDFKTFVTGSLPQAGIASLGLVAGFKRR